MTREEAIKIIDCYDIGFYDLSGEKIPADKLADAFDMAIEALSAEAEPKMTEEVREALMRLTMCAREECAMCKYKDKCGFEFQYNISTENMNTLLDALSADAVQGEWIEKYNGNGWNDFWDYTCSNCGKKYERADAVLYHANYCPNCGARMTPHKGGDTE